MTTSRITPRQARAVGIAPAFAGTHDIDCALPDHDSAYRCTKQAEGWSEWEIKDMGLAPCGCQCHRQMMQWLLDERRKETAL